MASSLSSGPRPPSESVPYRFSYFRLTHPSGIVVPDPQEKIDFASTKTLKEWEKYGDQLGKFKGTQRQITYKTFVLRDSFQKGEALAMRMGRLEEVDALIK